MLDPGQDRGELVEAALLVGYDNLAGELDGGIGVWRAAGLPMASIPLLDPATDHIPNGCRVLDVRLHGEWASGHIPGAAHTELGTLARPAAVAGLGGGPLAVMRGHGERAMTAASLLATAGAPGVSVLRGGPAGWAKATGPRPRVSAPVSGTAGTRAGAPAPPVRLGLRENWPQFTLLVVVNAFVGGMVGLERTTTSLVGTRVFHLTGYLAVFSFIVAFGVTKAVTNLVAGVADRPAHPQEPVGRRMGRRAAGPVPARLGPGLGLDRGRERAAGRQPGPGLVDDREHEDRPGRAAEPGAGDGPERGRRVHGGGRDSAGHRVPGRRLRAPPVPELIGVAYAAAGLALSVLVIRDTAAHVAAETATHPGPGQEAAATRSGPGRDTARTRGGPAPGMAVAPRKPFSMIFLDTSWRNRSLRGASQAGWSTTSTTG